MYKMVLGTDTLVSRLVKKKEDINELKYYEKYRDIVQKTEWFLEKNKNHLMLYGGAAINSLLPKPNKIYRDTELPDFDVFALDGEKMATQLVEYMQSHGYEYVTKFPAMHAGTWKIIIEGMQIVDFSTLPREIFFAIRKGHLVGNLGIPTTNLEYLRQSMIRIMATPENTDRWKKVLKRIKLFNKVFPPEVTDIDQIASEKYKPNETSDQTIALMRVQEYARTRKFVRVGMDAVQEILLERRKTRASYLPAGFMGPHCTLLVNGDLKKAADGLCKYLTDGGITAKATPIQMNPFDDSMDVAPNHMIIHAAGVPIACLFANDICWSYEITTEGLNRGTLPTMISWISRTMFIAPNGFSKKNVAIVYNLLVDILIRDRNVNRHYTLQCYGKETGLFTKKKEAFLKKKK